MSALTYSLGASWFHWCAGIPMIASIGAVLKAQQAPKAEKGEWMHRHKSMGLLSGMIVAPRMAYRVLSAGAYKGMLLSIKRREEKRTMCTNEFLMVHHSPSFDW